MDPISLAGAYQGLKAAKEILGTLFDAKVDAEAKSKIILAQSQLGEVQDALFNLRERLAELQQERDELRRKLDSSQGWNGKAAEYSLSNTAGGAIVYSFKGQPAHFACPTCFNKQEIHILQDTRTMHGSFKCTGCGAVFPVKPKTAWDALPGR